MNATKSAGASGTCTDSTFMTSAATDFGGLANVFSQFNAEDSNHLIASGLILTGLRQKYEDLGNVAPSCYLTQLYVVALSANMNDWVIMKLASVVDTANTATYAKDLTAQQERVAQILKGMQASLGVAAAPSAATMAATVPAMTVAPAPTAAATTSAALTCKDSAFLKGVVTDFGAVGDAVAKFNGEDPSHLIATGLILTALRQKYEDLAPVTPACFGTQLTLIAISANTSDYVTFKLASLVDKANAASYTADLTAQQTRIAQFLKLMQSTLGIVATATP